MKALSRLIAPKPRDHAAEPLEPHPLADIFPMMSPAEYAEHRDSIKATGQREAIVIHEGKILDGRNRYKACRELGLVPQLRDFSPRRDGEDPLKFVLSLNLHRRHLDESQRAMVAAKLKRFTHGGDRSKNPIGSLKRSDRAEKLKVGRTSVQRAEVVIDKGVPELQAVVDQGRMAVSVAEQVAQLPPEKQQKIATFGMGDLTRYARVVVKQERRDQRERELGAKICALPQRHYGIILADPEWDFETWSAAGMDRSAANHYPVSKTQNICARDVASIAADPCILFLWATPPMLPQALQVMAAWGFSYKSHIIWRKPTMITGYWFRAVHELLLVGTLGNVIAPAMGTQDVSVIDAPSGEHSEKPVFVHEMIERLWKTLPKIELNARGPGRPGWDVWGAEAEQPEAAE